MNDMLKVYVGCALSKAPESFVSDVENFKNQLRAEGFYVYDFAGVVKGTARDVYNWDMRYCVYNCDVFVAICDEPSIGLGWELAEATHYKKPVLAIARQGTRVTRMVQGAADMESNVAFVRYNELRGIIPLIKKMAKEVAEDKHAIHRLMAS